MIRNELVYEPNLVLLLTISYRMVRTPLQWTFALLYYGRCLQLLSVRYLSDFLTFSEYIFLSIELKKDENSYS